MQRIEVKTHSGKSGWRGWNAGLPVLAAFFVLFLLGGCEKAAEPAATVEAPPQGRAAGKPGANEDTHVLVTYFYTTYRCTACTLLETYSAESVEKGFPEKVRDGRLVFRSINVDEPENRHFVRDYSLYTKSVVISLVRNGAEVRWKNLPDIWRHLRSRDVFQEYMKGEIESFLREI